MIPNLRQYPEKKIYMPILEKLAKRGSNRKNMRASATQGDFYKSVPPNDFDLNKAQTN